MVWLYSHNDFLLHETGMHPECADRLRAITKRLNKSGLVKECEQKIWKPASLHN